MNVELVQKIKAHALSNYESDGWDFVVESFTDKEISEFIVEANATTFDDAIAALVKFTRILKERQDERLAERNEERRNSL